MAKRQSKVQPNALAGGKRQGRHSDGEAWHCEKGSEKSHWGADAFVFCQICIWGWGVLDSINRSKSWRKF